MSDVENLYRLIDLGREILRDGSPTGPGGYLHAALNIECAEANLFPEIHAMSFRGVREAREVAKELRAAAAESGRELARLANAMRAGDGGGRRC